MAGKTAASKLSTVWKTLQDIRSHRVIVAAEEFLNKVSGQARVNEVHRQVRECEGVFDNSRKQLIECREEYEKIAEQYSQINREVTYRNQQMSHMEDPDMHLGDYNELVKRRRELLDKTTSLKRTKEKLETLEKEAFAAFSSRLRESYTIDQFQKEKIGRITLMASVSLALLGPIFATLILEPYKRRKMEMKMMAVVENLNRKHEEQLTVAQRQALLIQEKHQEQMMLQIRRLVTGDPKGHHIPDANVQDNGSVDVSTDANSVDDQNGGAYETAAVSPMTQTVIQSVALCAVTAVTIWLMR